MINYILFALTQVAIVVGNAYLAFHPVTSECTSNILVFGDLFFRTSLIFIGSIELFFMVMIPLAIWFYKKKLYESCGCCVVIFKLLMLGYLLECLYNLVAYIFVLAGDIGLCSSGVLAEVIISMIVFMVRPIFIGVILRGIELI